MATGRISRDDPYAEFGEAFVVAAVTPERVVEVVRNIAGQSVELGPLKAGPADRATVRAQGTIGEPSAEEVDEALLTYTVRLPVELHLEVRVGTTTHFDANGHVELRLTVRTATPPAILIDVAEVTPGDVHFRLDAKGMQAKFIERAGDVAAELRRHTADYVNQRVGAPEARRFTRIELAPLIEQVWATL